MEAPPRSCCRRTRRGRGSGSRARSRPAQPSSSLSRVVSSVLPTPMLPAIARKYPRGDAVAAAEIGHARALGGQGRDAFRASPRIARRAGEVSSIAPRAPHLRVITSDDTGDSFEETRVRPATSRMMSPDTAAPRSEPRSGGASFAETSSKPVRFPRHRDRSSVRTRPSTASGSTERARRRRCPARQSGASGCRNGAASMPCLRSRVVERRTAHTRRRARRA